MIANPAAACSLDEGEPADSSATKLTVGQRLKNFLNPFLRASVLVGQDPGEGMGEPGEEDEDGQGITASSPPLSHLSRLRSVCNMRRRSSLAVEVHPGPSSAPPILSMANVAQLRSSMCRRSSLLVCSDLDGPDAPCPPATAAAAAAVSPCRVRRVSIMDAETTQALAPPTRPQVTAASPRARRVWTVRRTCGPKLWHIPGRTPAFTLAGLRMTPHVRPACHPPNCVTRLSFPSAAGR